MHDAVVSKLIAASRGSPCDSMASCLASCYRSAQHSQTKHSLQGNNIVSEEYRRSEEPIHSVLFFEPVGTFRYVVFIVLIELILCYLADLATIE